MMGDRGSNGLTISLLWRCNDISPFCGKHHSEKDEGQWTVSTNRGQIYSCNDNFQQLLLEFSLSHDPSEIILICWFGAQF